MQFCRDLEAWLLTFWHASRITLWLTFFQLSSQILCCNKCSVVSFASRVFPLFWNYGGTFLVCGSLETLSDMVPHSAYMTRPVPRDWELWRSYRHTQTQKYYVQVGMRISVVPHSGIAIENATSAASFSCWFEADMFMSTVLSCRRVQLKCFWHTAEIPFRIPAWDFLSWLITFCGFLPFLRVNAVIVSLNSTPLLPLKSVVHHS
jgi:hypothetical protein